MRKLLLSYVFLIGLGFLGAHRFYLERYYTGMIYLCTGGFCGVGVVVDFFMLPFMVADDIHDEGGNVLEYVLALFVGTAVFLAFCLVVSAMLFTLSFLF